MDYSMEELGAPELAKESGATPSIDRFGGSPNGTRQLVESTPDLNVDLGYKQRASEGFFSPTELGRGAQAGALNIAAGLAKTADIFLPGESSIPRRIDDYMGRHGRLLPSKDFNPAYDVGSQIPLLVTMMAGAGSSGVAARGFNLSAKGVSLAARTGQGAAMFNVVFGDKYERISKAAPDLSGTQKVGLAFANSLFETAVEFIGGPEKGLRQGMVNRMLARQTAKKGGMEAIETLGRSVGTGSYKWIKESFKEVSEEFIQAMGDELTDLAATGGEDGLDLRTGLDQALHAIVPSLILTGASSVYRNMQLEGAVRKHEQITAAMADASAKVDGQYLGGSFEAAQQQISDGFDQLEAFYAQNMDPETASALRGVMQKMATNMAAQRADKTPLSYIQDFQQLFVGQDLSSDQIQSIVDASNKGGDAFSETMERLIPNYKELTHRYVQDSKLNDLNNIIRIKTETLLNEYGEDIDADAGAREILGGIDLGAEGVESVDQAMENELLVARAKMVYINNRLAEVQERQVSEPATVTSEDENTRIESLISYVSARINGERNGQNEAPRNELAHALLGARRLLQTQYGGDSTTGELKRDIPGMSREEMINELKDISTELELDRVSNDLRSFIESDVTESVETLEDRFDRYQLPTVLTRDGRNNITPESAARAAVAMEDEFSILLWPQNLSAEQQRIASVYDALMEIADPSVYERTYFDKNTGVYETGSLGENHGLPVPVTVEKARVVLSSQLGQKVLDTFKVSKIGEAADAVGALYAKIEKLYKDSDPYARRNRAALRIAVELLEANAYERLTTTQIMEAERAQARLEARQRAEHAELLNQGEFKSLEDIEVDTSGASDVDELINKERERIRKLEKQRQAERTRSQAAMRVAMNLRNLPPSELDLFDAQEQLHALQQEILNQEQAEELARKKDELRRIEIELEQEANQKIRRNTLESSSEGAERKFKIDGELFAKRADEIRREFPSDAYDNVKWKKFSADESFEEQDIYQIDSPELGWSALVMKDGYDFTWHILDIFRTEDGANPEAMWESEDTFSKRRPDAALEFVEQAMSEAARARAISEQFEAFKESNQGQTPNTLQSSGGIGPSLAAYLIQTERAFSRDNASRRAMEIIDRLVAGEHEAVVAEFPDMPLSLRAMADTYSKRAEVKQRAEEQLTLLSGQKDRQTYAVYNRDQKLAVFFNTSTAEDVIHEWYHHIVDNDLIPTEMRDALLKRYAPDGVTDPNDLTGDAFVEFHENSVRALFAWMKGTKEAPADVRKAFNHIKAIMEKEAHALDERLADVFVGEVFGVKALTDDGNPSENSIRDEKTLAQLFDESVKDVDQETAERAALLLRQAVEAQVRDYPAINLLRSRAINTQTPEELNKTIFGFLKDRAVVRSVTEQVTGRRYDGEAHPYKELLDAAKAGDQQALSTLQEIAYRAIENADDTTVPPNWYHFLDNKARQRHGKDFKDLDEAQQRFIVGEAYRSTEAYAREKSTEKRYANLSEDPSVTGDASDLILQLKDDPRGKDMNAYDSGTVRNMISALDRKGSDISTWLTINTFDFYTFLDAMDKHVMEGAFNQAFGVRVKMGGDGAHRQYMKDADFLRRSMEKYGEFGNMTKRHVVGSNKLVLDGKRLLGIYSIYKMGPKAMAELESHEDLGTTVEARRSVIRDAVKLVEGTPGLLNFSKHMQDYFKYIWKSLDDTHRSIHRDADGNSKGIGRFEDWYFPFIRENGFFERKDASSTLNIMDVVNRPSEKRVSVEGRYQERKWGQGKLNLDALVVFQEYQRQAQNYIGKARLVFEMSAIAESIRGEMNQRDRTGRLHHALRTFIEREQYPTGRMNPLTDAERVIRIGRGNVLPAMLMGRVVSVLRQPVSLANAATQLPAKWIGRMTANFGEMLKTGFRPAHAIDSLTGAHNPFVGHPMYERMVQHSPGILARSFDPDMQDVATQTYNNGLMGKMRIQHGKLKGRTVGEVLMHPFRHMDLTTVISVWNAAFDFQRENFAGTGLSEEQLNKKAALYADKTVERTQPASNTAGRNMIQTGHEGIKALFPFTGQIFKNFQFINQHVIGTMKRAYRSGGSAEMLNVLLHGEFETVTNSRGETVRVRKAQPVLQKAFFTFVVPAIALGALTRRREPESWDEIFDDMVAWNLSSIPLIGGAFAASYYYKMDGDAGVIYLDWVNSIGNVIADTRNDDWNKYTTQDLLRSTTILGVPDVASRLATEIGYAMNGEQADWLKAVGLGVKERE